MKYWDEMLTKYGFSDGGSVPLDAEFFRDMYVLAFNALSDKLGYKTKVTIYDRAGLHNWCMILYDEETFDPKEADRILQLLDNVNTDHIIDAYIKLTFLANLCRKCLLKTIKQQEVVC